MIDSFYKKLRETLFKVRIRGPGRGYVVESIASLVPWDPVMRLDLRWTENCGPALAFPVQAGLVAGCMRLSLLDRPSISLCVGNVVWGGGIFSSKRVGIDF